MWRYEPIPAEIEGKTPAIPVHEVQFPEGCKCYPSACISLRFWRRTFRKLEFTLCNYHGTRRHELSGNDPDESDGFCNDGSFHDERSDGDHGCNVHE
jgi:hypothetical protein